MGRGGEGLQEKLTTESADVVSCVHKRQGAHVDIVQISQAVKITISILSIFVCNILCCKISGFILLW